MINFGSTMMKKNPLEDRDHFLSVVRKEYEETGKVSTLLFIKSKGSPIQGFPIPELSNGRAEALAEILKALISQEVLEAFVILTPGAAVECKYHELQELLEWKKTHGHVQSHPNHKVFISVLFSEPDNEDHRMAYVDSETKELSEWEKWSTAPESMIDTIFGNIWEKGRAKPN